MTSQEPVSPPLSPKLDGQLEVPKVPEIKVQRVEEAQADDILFNRSTKHCNRKCTLAMLIPCFFHYEDPEVAECNAPPDPEHTPGPNGDQWGPRPATQVFGEMQNETIAWHVILPNAVWKSAWDWFIIVLVLYNTFLIPYNFAFDPESVTAFIVLDYCVDFCFLIDIYLSFNHAFEDRLGRAVTEPKLIGKEYIRTWFFIDLIATLPIDLIFVGFLTVLGKDSGGSNLQVFSLLKAPRLLRIGRLMKKFDKMAAANALRIFKLMFFFVIVAHLLGCLWWFIGTQQSRDVRWNRLIECDDVPDPSQCDDDTGGAQQYVTSLYWALMTMTTVGYGDIVPVTLTERSFTVFVFLLGAILYAGIFGNMALLIQRIDAKGELYRQKVQGVNELLTFYNVGDELGSRVRDSIDFYWKFTGGGLDFFEHLSQLPRALQSDVALSLYEHVVSTAPIIRGCSQSFLREIAMRLRPQAALPNQYIFRAGDSGSEMFFVGKGELAIMSSDGQTCFDVIGEGALVGERGLFFTGRRSAGLKTVTHAELYGITKKDFQEVLSSFPEEYERMKALAYAKRGADKKNRNKAAEDKERRDAEIKKDKEKERLKMVSRTAGESSEAADGLGQLAGEKHITSNLGQEINADENPWAREVSRSHSGLSRVSRVSSVSKFDIEPPQGVSRIRRMMGGQGGHHRSSSVGGGKRHRHGRKSSFAIPRPKGARPQRLYTAHSQASRRSSHGSMASLSDTGAPQMEPHSHPPGMTATDCRICNPAETGNLGTMKSSAPRLTRSALDLAAGGNADNAERQRRVAELLSKNSGAEADDGEENLKLDNQGVYSDDERDYNLAEMTERILPVVADAIAQGERENRNWLIDQMNDMRLRQRSAFETSSKRFSALEASAKLHKDKLASIELLLQDLATGMKKLAEATTQSAKAQARQAQVQQRQQQIALLSGQGGLDASPFIVGNRGGNRSGNAFWLSHQTKKKAKGEEKTLLPAAKSTEMDKIK